MCATSMIMDHYSDKWHKQFYPDRIEPFVPYVPPEPRITDEELAEFRSLLDRARKYDEEHDQPECELDEKRQALLKMAEQLGVEIDFL